MYVLAYGYTEISFSDSSENVFKNEHYLQIGYELVIDVRLGNRRNEDSRFDSIENLPQTRRALSPFELNGHKRFWLRFLRRDCQLRCPKRRGSSPPKKKNLVQLQNGMFV
ncbi:hypothetical protein AVEN_141429-1 [Araneus ventricosus]|uniref:Uncharacterized protein n=1 Tax=Araneus ventricosus TaxID=182803 RepID=A0A4Y2RZG1_ARAVE|nr:hypothetical protein AVEN_141429-1 [Araneus ventricosus]